MYFSAGDGRRGSCETGEELWSSRSISTLHEESAANLFDIVSITYSTRIVSKGKSTEDKERMLDDPPGGDDCTVPRHAAEKAGPERGGEAEQQSSRAERIVSGLQPSIGTGQRSFKLAGARWRNRRNRAHPWWSGSGLCPWLCAALPWAFSKNLSTEDIYIVRS
jgi:hypothetical protein